MLLVVRLASHESYPKAIQAKSVVTGFGCVVLLLGGTIICQKQDLYAKRTRVVGVTNCFARGRKKRFFNLELLLQTCLH